MQELIIGAGATVLVAKDILNKLLGPTAEYLGDELKVFTEQRVTNLRNILSNAQEKSGSRLDSPGRVPPKILKSVINEGSYAEDPIAVEYFGGVLASSKTEIDRDDRGARLIKIVDSLSAYQLRTHYLLYSTIAHIFSNSDNDFAMSESRAKMQIFLPLEGYCHSMEFTQSEWENEQIMAHIWHGMESENLLEGEWKYGSKKALQKTVKNVPGPGIVCQPSALGAELYLWAFGHGDKSLDYILSGELKAEIHDFPSYIPNAIATK